MSPPPEEDQELDWTDEAREIAASAAALVREWVEDDIQTFERQPIAPVSVEEAAGEAAESPTRTTETPKRAATPSPVEPTSEPADTRALSLAASTHPSTTSSTPPSTTPTASPAAVPWAEGRPTLDEVRAHLGECTRCGLCEARKKIVFGDGNPNARILFVGEGPGEQEDKTGLPFVGRAGDLLTDMIEKGLKIPRSDVYICNIVKCRPPQNRTPVGSEVDACRPFLDGQIRAVAPKVIVTLGRPAASLLLEREVAITRLRGTWQEYQGIPLMPTLHPAFVLRRYTPENRRAVWEDLKAAYERSQA